MIMKATTEEIIYLALQLKKIMGKLLIEIPRNMKINFFK